LRTDAFVSNNIGIYVKIFVSWFISDLFVEYNDKYYSKFIAVEGNCSAPGKIRLSERRTSLFVIPSVRILSKGEAGEGWMENVPLYGVESYLAKFYR